MKCPPRSFLAHLAVGLLLVLVFSAGASAQVEIDRDLAGQWTMDDLSPSLNYPANKRALSILRVSASKSTWADGFFFLKWVNAPRPERGYYSLETGRVWITTYRWVNDKEQRVEYRGVVERNDEGTLVWSGTASTTGSRKVTWKFEAVKN